MLDELPIDTPETNDTSAATEHQGLGRRGLLKAALAASTSALATGLAVPSAHAASGETSAGNAVTGPTAIRPGILLKVLDVSGVRAGVLTEAKPGQPVSAARKAFATGDAYADPGYWFFFYEAGGLLAAARVFTTKNSGKQVGNAVMGSAPRWVRNLSAAWEPWCSTVTCPADNCGAGSWRPIITTRPVKWPQVSNSAALISFRPGA